MKQILNLSFISVFILTCLFYACGGQIPPIDICQFVPKDSPQCAILGCSGCIIPPITTTTTSTTTSTTSTTTVPTTTTSTTTTTTTLVPVPPGDCRKLSQSSLCLENKPGTFRDEVNATLSAVTGCAVGSDCDVIDWQMAIVSLMTRLNAKGYCSSFDVNGGNQGLGSELGIRDSENFTEFYQPVTSNKKARWSTPRSVCTPAIDEETLEEVKAFWDIGVPSVYNNPTPGPLAIFDVKTHNIGPNWRTIDSTPLVGPDALFCRTIGYTDGRRYCPPRAEGTDPSTVLACLNLVVGPRPTWPMWYWNNVFVPDNAEGDVVHDDNPYHLLVKPTLHGTAKVCGNNGTCGELSF